MTNHIDKTIQSALKKKALIRANFEYLISLHGFDEDLNITSDPIYSEVRFTKTGWTISILTIAHGTKISLRLESPQGISGFLSHLFQIFDKRYNKRAETTNDILASIRLESDCLSQFGKPILEGDPIQMKKILDTLIDEQEKWLRKVGLL
jgi:hypothetical protein